MLFAAKKTLLTQTSKALTQIPRQAFGFSNDLSGFLSTSASKHPEKRYDGGRREDDEDVGDKVSNTAAYMTDKAREGTSKVTEIAYDGGRREGDEDVADMVSNTAAYMTDRAREGTGKATETALNMGETVVETMEDAMRAAKETTRKVKDNVLSSSDEERGEEWRDTSVDDLRRRAGGYDKRS